MQIMLSSFNGVVVLIWLAMVVVSAITSAKKKDLMKKKDGQQPQHQPWSLGNQPVRPQSPQNGDWRTPNPMNESSAPMQRAQWDDAKIRQQMSRFQESSAAKPQGDFADSYPEEESYLREEEFQHQSDVFVQPIPVERVEEYVPDELAEMNSQAGDTFYSSKVIQNSLHDEEDIAREKAYHAGHKEAFAQRKEKKKSHFSNLLTQNNSLKKAILLSTILEQPKALRED